MTTSFHGLDVKGPTRKTASVRPDHIKGQYRPQISVWPACGCADWLCAAAESVCGVCVWLEAACLRPEHEPHRVWSCIQKLFCSLCRPDSVTERSAELKSSRTASYHFMPEKSFWTIYVIKVKNNSVNKAKIQEYAIGINLFKAVYERVYIWNFPFPSSCSSSPSLLILHEHKL